ncbi:sporulation protein YpjB [Fischerella sp. JS2]|uniref:sporulation protein YpjB n=1 Tax=Fischerella sp. JS2 TaxID=2597771 RepID=UPI0028F167BF|nr:sporulation protein YpjB [Fischerella sp. JS2]
MNNSTKIIIVGSLLGSLGIADLAKAISANQPQLPVAVIPQHHSSTQMIVNKDKREKPDAPNDADTEVNDDKVPTSLSQVSEYGESVYDMAKANDWTKATANLTSLENTAKSLRTEIKSENKTELAQLDSKIAALKGAVTAKNRISAMHDANQVTLIAANITKEFKPKVPVEVTLLDYYGRELEIWSATGNTSKLKTTASQMRRTWNAVRPSILAHGGTTQVQKFDGLVASIEAAKSSKDYARLVTPVLDEVDNLEKVFK